MELTAKEILEKHCLHNQAYKTYGFISSDMALAAMKEAVELAFDAGRNIEYANNFGPIPSNYPNNQEFIKSLFPEKSTVGQ